MNAPLYKLLDKETRFLRRSNLVSRRSQRVNAINAMTVELTLIRLPWNRKNLRKVISQDICSISLLESDLDSNQIDPNEENSVLNLDVTFLEPERCSGYSINDRRYD